METPQLRSLEPVDVQACAPLPLRRARYIQWTDCLESEEDIDERLLATLTAPAMAQHALQFGDLVSLDGYRDCFTVIVTDCGVIQNPDYSASGYLTIPLEITSRFADAVAHYSDALKVVCFTILEVGGADEALVGKLGALPEGTVARVDVMKGILEELHVKLPGKDWEYAGLWRDCDAVAWRAIQGLTCM
ncbi:MAG: uncharacterized protein KVP18_000454 [Porospora cf. gigantea A]|uniref:uncharacterized protein n=1 Tax=Porospora cf. gigantea A TaxID=2853593 RepID=UPI00355A8E1C|nr:MAG: hypothetical protein KVP18_000454 [Porospora cf. gigantea A]